MSFRNNLKTLNIHWFHCKNAKKICSYKNCIHLFMECWLHECIDVAINRGRKVLFMNFGYLAKHCDWNATRAGYTRIYVYMLLFTVLEFKEDLLLIFNKIFCLCSFIYFSFVSFVSFVCLFFSFKKKHFSKRKISIISRDLAIFLIRLKF